jgi:hypothetical protein
MRNFGRFTLPADRAAQKGMMDPSSVSDADLAAAADTLVLAEDCARAVVEDPSEALLPSKAEKLRGEARDAYVKLYRDTMKDFWEGLRSYEAAVRDVLKQASRDFTPVRDWSKEVSARATRAHELLQ